MNVATTYQDNSHPREKFDETLSENNKTISKRKSDVFITTIFFINLAGGGAGSTVYKSDKKYMTIIKQV